MAYGDYPVNACLIAWQADADRLVEEKALALAAVTSAEPTSAGPTTAAPATVAPPRCAALLNSCDDDEQAAGGKDDGNGGLTPCELQSCDDVAALMGCGAVQSAIGPELVPTVCENCDCGPDYVMTTTPEPTAEPSPLPTPSPTTVAPTPGPTPVPTEPAATVKPIVFNDESRSVAAALGLLILSRAF